MYEMEHQMAKKRTSLTLPAGLMEEAQEYDINLSQAAEEGIARALKKAREDAWKRENRHHLEAMNRYVEKNGLPLAKYRLF